MLTTSDIAALGNARIENDRGYLTARAGRVGFELEQSWLRRGIAAATVNAPPDILEGGTTIAAGEGPYNIPEVSIDDPTATRDPALVHAARWLVRLQDGHPGGPTIDLTAPLPTDS